MNTEVQLVNLMLPSNDNQSSFRLQLDSIVIQIRGITHDPLKCTMAEIKAYGKV